MRNVISKYFISKGYSVYNYPMQLLFVDGFIGTIGLLIQLKIYGNFLTTEVFLYGLFAGILATIGIAMINYSISVGVSGPASALSNLSTIVQTLLDYFILGQGIGILQILGLISGILGAVVLAIGMEVINALVNLFKYKRKD